MKQSIITAFVTSVVGLIPIISESILGEGLDKVIGTGMLIIGILIIYAIIGELLWQYLKNNAEIVKGIFLGMELILLIGFAVCSLNF